MPSIGCLEKFSVFYCLFASMIEKIPCREQIIRVEALRLLEIFSHLCVLNRKLSYSSNRFCN